MSRVQQFLKSFRQDDDLEPGLFMKNDGTVWLRNPDGSETQLPGGGVSDVLLISIADQTLAGTANFKITPDMISATTFARGADLSTDMDEDGNMVFVTAGGGDFAASFVFQAQLTPDEGNTEQRVLQGYINNNEGGTSTGADIPLTMPPNIPLVAAGTALPFWDISPAGIAVPPIGVFSPNGSADDSYALTGMKAVAWKVGAA